MGWNGSGIEKVEVESSTSTYRFNYKALVAGLVVVLGGAIAAWVMMGEKSEKIEKGEKVKPSQIAEVKPQIVTNAAEEVRKPKAYSEMSREEKLKYYEDKYGENIPKGLRTHVYYLKNPPRKTFRPKMQYEYLRHSSERAVASLLLTEPGEYFLQCPRYSSAFDNDFMSALIDPITASDDDAEEVRRTKDEVERLKQDIARICKEEGKRPHEVMNEQAAMMYELGRYKQELTAEIDKLYKSEEFTDEDVAAYCDAADKMLERKGLPKMAHRSLTSRSLYLKRQAARKARMSNNNEKQGGQ